MSIRPGITVLLPTNVKVHAITSRKLDVVGANLMTMMLASGLPFTVPEVDNGDKRLAEIVSSFDPWAAISTIRTDMDGLSLDALTDMLRRTPTDVLLRSQQLGRIRTPDINSRDGDPSGPVIIEPRTGQFNPRTDNWSRVPRLDLGGRDVPFSDESVARWHARAFEMLTALHNSQTVFDAESRKTAPLWTLMEPTHFNINSANGTTSPLWYYNISLPNYLANSQEKDLVLGDASATELFHKMIELIWRTSWNKIEYATLMMTADPNLRDVPTLWRSVYEQSSYGQVSRFLVGMLYLQPYLAYIHLLVRSLRLDAPNARKYIKTNEFEMLNAVLEVPLHPLFCELIESYGTSELPSALSTQTSVSYIAFAELADLESGKPLMSEDRVDILRSKLVNHTVYRLGELLQIGPFGKSGQAGFKPVYDLLGGRLDFRRVTSRIIGTPETVLAGPLLYEGTRFGRTTPSAAVPTHPLDLPMVSAYSTESVAITGSDDRVKLHDSGRGVVLWSVLEHAAMPLAPEQGALALSALRTKRYGEGRLSAAPGRNMAAAPSALVTMFRVSPNDVADFMRGEVINGNPLAYAMMAASTPAGARTTQFIASFPYGSFDPTSAFGRGDAWVPAGAILRKAIPGTGAGATLRDLLGTAALTAGLPTERDATGAVNKVHRTQMADGKHLAPIIPPMVVSAILRASAGTGAELFFRQFSGDLIPTLADTSLRALTAAELALVPITLLPEWIDIIDAQESLTREWLPMEHTPFTLLTYDDFSNGYNVNTAMQTERVYVRDLTPVTASTDASGLVQALVNNVIKPR